MAAAPEISVDAAIAVSPELDGIFTKKENKSGIDGFFLWTTLFWPNPNWPWSHVKHHGV